MTMISVRCSTACAGSSAPVLPDAACPTTSRPGTRAISRANAGPPTGYAADEQNRAQVEEPAAQMQGATGDTVEVAFADQGYTGQDTAAAALGWGIRLAVVKLPEVRQGFVLLPRRWVVERSFARLSRFRRLARDYERLPGTVAGLHIVAFAVLMFGRLTKMLLAMSA